MDQIHRSADGRFILSIDETDMIMRPASVGSENSGSDDGGFLLKPSESNRSSWRPRPLVTSPSQLSIRSHLSGNRNFPRSYGGLLSIGHTPHHLLQTVPVQYHPQPIDQNLHINTISGNIPGPVMANLYTPSRESRIVSSSPANSIAGIRSPWTPSAMYFNDLSSVLQPSSAERSFPTPRTGINQLLYLQERYSQELPSLRAIHEETRRMAQGFVPLQIQMHSPSWRYSQPPTSHHHHHHHRHRTRSLPRHHGRMARSVPDLNSPNSQLNMAMHMIEASPESRSSSSGFGSKNTSTQHNQSSQSGSTNEWRYLPPYRPPPPAPTIYHQYANNNTIVSAQDTPPYNMGHWLELITRLNAASENVNIPKAVDVGSVDGHYEFDPTTATPTPTASTPTGVRDDHFIGDSKYTTTTPPYSQQTLPLQQRKRLSKYDNIEARVQAMKEEFYAYRKRQAMRRSGVELESAC